MIRIHPCAGTRLRTALIGALCLGLYAYAPGEGTVFWIDGMAVDILAQEVENEARFNSRIPTLAESGPRTPRTRLFDNLEPPRDPLIQRQLSELAQEADQFARDGNIPAARMALRDALALDPYNAGLLSRAAIHASTQRDFERAAGFFRRFLEAEPDNAAHLAGYAAVLLRLARLDETERYLQRAEALQPDTLVVRFTRRVLDVLHERRTGDSVYWMRRPVDQMALLAGWLQADSDTLTRLVGPTDYEHLCDLTLGPGTKPNLVEINETFQRLQNARRDGYAEEGLRHIEHLHALGVASLGLVAERAEILFNAGRENESVDLWKTLTARDNAWREAWVNLGFALFRTDNYAQAAEALDRARSDREPPIVRFLLASAHSLAGDDDEARALYAELARTHPEEFRQWIEADPRFHRAVRRMDIYRNLLRRIGIPPELE